MGGSANSSGRAAMRFMPRVKSVPGRYVFLSEVATIARRRQTGGSGNAEHSTDKKTAQRAALPAQPDNVVGADDHPAVAVLGGSDHVRGSLRHPQSQQDALRVSYFSRIADQRESPIP